MRHIGSFAPAPRGGICEVEIDGELVLLDTSSGALHLLNRVAAAVWSELDGTRTVDAIIEALIDAADADGERVRADVIGLLEQLGRGELLAAPLPSS